MASVYDTIEAQHSGVFVTLMMNGGSMDILKFKNESDAAEAHADIDAAMFMLNDKVFQDTIEMYEGVPATMDEFLGLE